MRRRLHLQQRSTSVDSAGGPQEDWPTLADVWAAVEPLSGSERLMAAQQGVILTHQVTLWYRKDLAAATGHDLDLVEGNRVLRIRQVLNEREENHILVLLCEELQPA